MRTSWIITAALIAAGCDDGGTVNLPGGEDAGRTDARTTDSTLPDPDAGPIEDGAVDPGDGGVPDEGIEPDQGPPMPFEGAPSFDQVAAATAEGRVYVVWSDEEQVRWGVLDGDDSFLRGDEPLSPEPADEVAALQVGGVPWVAFATDERVVLRQGDLLPEGPEVELDLKGPELLLAAAGQRVMVIGHDDDGTVAWQLVDEAGDASPLVRDQSGLPFPNSAAGQRNGTVLRFAEDGQCVFINDAGVAVGNFPCRFGPGELIGDGDRILLSHQIYSDDVREPILGVSPLFGTVADTYGVAGVAFPDIELPVVDGERAMVGLHLAPGDQLQQVTLKIAGIGGLWDSVDAWGAAWPYPDARLMIRRDDTAFAFRFGDPARPAITQIPLMPRSFDGPAYDIAFNPECSPTVERCDNVDQDCDGQPANGLCCEHRAEDRMAIPGLRGVPVQMLVSDSESRDVYIVAIRVDPEPESEEDELLWQAYTVRLDERPRRIRSIEDAEPAPERMFADMMRRTDDGGVVRRAQEGIAFIQAGGARVLVAKEQASGDVYAWWYHKHRHFRGEEPAEPGIIPCAEREVDVLPNQWCAPKPTRINCPASDVLAVDVIDHNHVDGIASILLICKDKLMRVFFRDGVAPVEYEFPHPPVEWATITRSGNRVSQLLVGYERDQAWMLSYSLFLASTGQPPEVQNAPPRDLRALEAGAAAHPIWLHSTIGRPSVQLREEVGKSSVRINVDGQYKWAPVVTSGEQYSVRYAPQRRQLVTTGRYGEDTGFWVVDVTGDTDLNLWSTEPAFVVPGREPLWDVTLGDIAESILYIERSFRDGVDVHELVLKRVDCASL